MNLIQIIENLLFPDDNRKRLRDAAHGYFKFLSDTNGIGDGSLIAEDDVETILATGKAISPKSAARCVLDYSRTSRFLRGIYSAIDEAKNRFPNEKIEILYAGCGPFAALAVPFCFIFSSGEIGFTLIDIHQRSLDYASKIFQKLDCEDFIEDYIQTDAAVYRPENGKKFHIVITETMQKTLEKEPQVAITLNLLKHLYKNGIFIPQKIKVEAYLADPQKEFSIEEKTGLYKRERIHLGKIFELSKESAADEKVLFEPKVLELSADVFHPKSLMLFTTLEIFGSITLDEYNSGITYPTILCHLEKIEPGQKIRVRYMRSDNPHFEHCLI